MSSNNLWSGSWGSVWAMGGTIALVYIAMVLVYRIFFHPLAKYPGPWLGKFTDLVPYWAVFQNRRTLMQYELLSKYGSPVRVGTNELLFSDMQSWGDIYGQSSNPCTKDPSVYNMFTVTGAINVANAVHRPQHARLRRLLSHGFSANALLESESLTADKIEYFVDNIMLAKGTDGPVEVYRKIHEHYLDIVSHLSFGAPFNCLKGENPDAFHDVEAFANIVPAISFFPLLRFAPIPFVQINLRRLRRLQTVATDNVTSFTNRVTPSKDKGGLQKSFLANLVTAKDAETGSTLSMPELVEHAIIFLVAGSGTTASAMTYLLWELGRRKEVQERLSTEIRDAFPDPKIMPTYEKASNLGYLKCVIEETLRLHGPLSTSGPRISPGRMISGNFVPHGIVVSTCAYATARDPRVFSEPCRFIPERWLKATPEMKNMSRPFSYGPRNCIGKHVAEIGIVLTLARLCQLADFSVDSSITEEMMRPKDKGSIEPWGGKLCLQVKPIRTKVV